MKDYYKILGVKPDANGYDIKKAWHKLARKYHPDLNPGNNESEEIFKELTEAYEILRDEEKRAVYDLTGGTVFYSSIIQKREIKHYFYVTADRLDLSVNDEVAVTYTYSGEGRVFRKPSFEGFFLTGPPYVSFRKLIHEDQPIRETSLTYVLSPVKKGRFEIGRATIRIEGKEYETEPVILNVSANKCFFIEGNEADGPPLKFPMNYEYNSPNERLKLRGSNPGHMILIPRSRTAFLFHGIGMTLKWVCMIAGAIYAHNYTDVHFIFGATGGSLFGGINCQLMYWLVGMKSKYRYAIHFPLVEEYHDRGYQYGSSTGTPVVGSSMIYKFTRLIT